MSFVMEAQRTMTHLANTQGVSPKQWWREELKTLQKFTLQPRVTPDANYALQQLPTIRH